MRHLLPRKAYLDRLAGTVVRARGRCQNPRCRTPVGSYNPLCWSHIIPRDCLHLRWLPENALCLCLACERYHTDHPIEQRALFISIIGEDAFWALKRRENVKEFIDYGKLAYMLNKIIKNQALRVSY